MRCRDSMIADQDTRRFVLSWQKAGEYPLNLVSQGCKLGALRAHRKLLDETAPNLFNPRSRVVVIEFDEKLDEPSTLRIITSDHAAKHWLAVPDEGTHLPSPTISETAPEEILTPPVRAQSQAGSEWTCVTSRSNTLDLADKHAGLEPTAAVVAPTPANPNASIRCRFIFFQAASSQARLDVTREVASWILTYFQVMPSYIDYMTVFAIKIGEQVDASDLRFSGFRERLLLSPLSTGSRGLSLPHLGLSGRGFQICFNLKSVSLKKAVGIRERWQWSSRQAVFHHQFDVGHGTSLWIVTSARDEIQKRIQELTSNIEADRSFDTPAKSFISSLAVHSVLAQWASEDWRGYIRWLEQTIDALRSGTFVPSAEDISFVQKKEDETNRVAMMLRANADILESIAIFYRELMKNVDFPLRSDAYCQRAVADFLVELRDYTHDIQLHVDRAQTLCKITADRKNLVQQHLQSHATSKMEAMTHQAQKEAVTMRIIAVVTLIYLPATFVSTLFSTDIVKYQNVDGEESYSALALQRWFSITVPLTLITFAMAAGWLARDKIMAYFRRPRRTAEFDLEKLD